MRKTKYTKLLKQSKKLYNKINKVYCKALNQYVIFNSKGFYHLRYDGTLKARSKKESMYKLGLLPLAVSVIKNAKEISKCEKRYSRRLEKNVTYWRLESIVGKQQVLTIVILRKVGNGNIIFYSIMKK